MSRMQRSPLTAAEETEFWVRWKRGELLPAIGRALGRQRSTLAGYVAGHGGIPPPVRRRPRGKAPLGGNEHDPD